MMKSREEEETPETWLARGPVRVSGHPISIAISTLIWTCGDHQTMCGNVGGRYGASGSWRVRRDVVTL